MNRRIIVLLGLAIGLPLCAGGFWDAAAGEFEAPIRLMGGDAPVSVESPGYAAPCWADVTGDQKKDLLVGQFAGGKIRVYKNLGDLKFAKPQWLKAEGKVAEVPGVW